MGTFNLAAVFWKPCPFINLLVHSLHFPERLSRLNDSLVGDVQNIFQSVCCVGTLETDKEEDENSMRVGIRLRLALARHNSF